MDNHRKRILYPGKGLHSCALLLNHLNEPLSVLVNTCDIFGSIFKKLKLRKIMRNKYP